MHTKCNVQTGNGACFKSVQKVFVWYMDVIKHRYTRSVIVLAVALGGVVVTGVLRVCA